MQAGRKRLMGWHTDEGSRVVELVIVVWSRGRWGVLVGCSGVE